MTKTEVLELVKGLNLKPKPRDGWVNFSCIFAPWSHESGSDRHPSAGISTGERPSIYLCQACDRSGPVPVLLAQLQFLTGKNLGEFIDWTHELWVRDVRNLDDSDYSPSSKKPKPIDQIMSDYDVYDEEILQKFNGIEPHPMLKNRGIDVSTVDKWGIGYDRLRARITFPIRRPDGKLIGLIGRTVKKENPKYLFYWTFRKNAALFGAQFLKPADAEKDLVLVEGPFDAMAVYQAGYRSVACFGAKLSFNQSRIIRRYARNRVIVFFDGDKAGRQGISMARQNLESYVEVLIAKAPKGKDPGDLSTEQIKSAVSEAQAVV